MLWCTSMSDYESFGGLIATYAVGITLAIGGSALVGEYVEAHYHDDDARAYLEDSGYTDLDLTDTDTVLVGFAGCDYSDGTKYEFSATSPTGNETEVMVCKGIFKGATIREAGQ